jgi:hypothetical protein
LHVSWIPLYTAWQKRTKHTIIFHSSMIVRHKINLKVYPAKFSVSETLIWRNIQLE